MNDFNRGIEYALDFIEKNMIGKVVNGQLMSVITKEMMEEIRNNIHKKCNFCPVPCEEAHCCTKE